MPYPVETFANVTTYCSNLYTAVNTYDKYGVIGQRLVAGNGYALP